MGRPLVSSVDLENRLRVQWQEADSRMAGSIHCILNLLPLLEEQVLLCLDRLLLSGGFALRLSFGLSLGKWSSH